MLWQPPLILAEGKRSLNASASSWGDLNSCRSDTYYTSLEYFVSLSTGMSWFKNQLQQVRALQWGFSSQKMCTKGARGEYNFHEITTEVYKTCESVMIHPWMLPLPVMLPQQPGKVRAAQLKQRCILCLQCTSATFLPYLEFFIKNRSHQWKLDEPQRI